MAVIAMVTACVSWGQAIYFDGHKAVHDSRTDMWLCSVPREAFGSEWMPVVTFDSTMTNVTIDGMAVLNGDQILLDGVTGGHLFPLRAMNGGTAITGNVTFTWLPVLELNGTFSNEYAPGTVSLNDPDGDGKSDMLAKLKWRGGITNHGDRHKRNYHIKFVDSIGEKKNRRLLGMRKDNHWKLDAGQIDPLRIRNRVCSDLWLDMARDPWFKSIDSTIVNGSHGRVTELFLNGEYYGIYGLIEPVDRKQLGLIKHDTVANVFHGQQWVAKLLYPTWQLPKYNNNSETWNGNEVSYPEFEDVSPTDWSTLYNAFEFVRQCDAVDNYSQLTDSIAKYFDIPVMEDYYIFLITLQALDNETKNIYYSCYDKAEGATLLTLTPWDLDISLGAKSLSYLTDDLVRPDRPVKGWINNVPLGDLFNHCIPYRKHIIKRYWELRQTWLDTDSLVARFQTAVDELENCGAAAREERRWSRDSDIMGKVLDISQEMDYVAGWIRQRLAYLDENVFVTMQPVMGDVNDDGSVDIQDVTILIGHVLNGDVIDEENADIDQNSAIDIDDVVQVIQVVLGIQ
jgi:hypothetical protein